MQFNLLTSHDLKTVYQQEVEQDNIRFDPAQQEAINALAELSNRLESYRPSAGASLFEKILAGKKYKQSPKGYYIYGDVGRGKSMVMDMFYATVPIANKRRVHFYNFMAEIHQELHNWRKKYKHDQSKKDPLPDIARHIAQQSWLLCFDEFQVTDITDAMLLGRLFSELFKCGVVVVATSNRIPDDLYKDGLQRDSFLPFIALIKSKMHLLELKAECDYRLDRLKSIETTYFTPLGDAADQFIQDSFKRFCYDETIKPDTIIVQGRKLTINHTSGDTAMISFHELCEQPLGSSDYEAIANEFHTLFITDIPQMNKEQRNEAKRFVMLIDALYEHKVNLICSAAVPPQELYPAGDGSFEFERTASRLMEMQSESYFGKEHL